ncbi:unnamed protein product [Laminaria digitata]
MYKIPFALARVPAHRFKASRADGALAEDSPPPLSFLDVPYFEGEGACDEKHRLDVYIPSAPFPRARSRTCLFVHGGSWQRGDRRHPAVPDQLYGNIGRAFARAGMVGLVMSYRLAPGVQHPEQIRDVARAVRWARDNVSRYGGDQNDLVLVGHSAGAHLAALCLADPRWLEEVGIVASPSPAAPTAAAAADTRGSPSLPSRQDRKPPPPLPSSPSSSPARPTPGGSTQTNRNTAGVLRRPQVPPQLPRRNSIVSGFVGISGVYDIPRMGANAVGGMLAREVFGTDRRDWTRASPVHCVRTATAAAAKVAGRSSDRAAATTRAETMTPESTVGRPSRDSIESGRETDSAACSNSCTGGDGAGKTPAPAFPADSASSAIEKANDYNTAAAAAVVACPLLHTEALLITASTDFHLKDDAEALMEALSDARRAVDGLSIERSEDMLIGEGAQSSRIDLTTGDVLRAGRDGGGVGVEARWRKRDEARHGSVRHVCLDGEDHFSTMVSFGEPGKEASDTVLEFILGLPPP